MDVFIIESERGKGLSKILLDDVFSHKELRDVKKWMLSTNDAHNNLYAKFGFHTLNNFQKLMEKSKVD